MTVLGRREVEAGTLAVRERGAGSKQTAMSLDDFVSKVLEEIRTRKLGD